MTFRLHNPKYYREIFKNLKIYGGEKKRYGGVGKTGLLH